MSIVDTKRANADAQNPTSTWWRNGVVYQVYIRSFADGNGDGIGDIAGLRSRLSYLHDLGIDAIWINPWYQSPLDDGGYDVTDYRKIDERIGTTAQATASIAELTRQVSGSLAIWCQTTPPPSTSGSRKRWPLLPDLAPVPDFISVVVEA